MIQSSDYEQLRLSLLNSRSISFDIPLINQFNLKKPSLTYFLRFHPKFYPSGFPIREAPHKHSIDFHFIYSNNSF